MNGLGNETNPEATPLMIIPEGVEKDCRWSCCPPCFDWFVDLDESMLSILRSEANGNKGQYVWKQRE
jgi:hypothetical protein